jgi:hypothetical protein
MTIFDNFQNAIELNVAVNWYQRKKMKGRSIRESYFSFNEERRRFLYIVFWEEKG